MISMNGRHKLLQTVLHLVLIIMAISTVAPLVFLMFNSFKSNNEIVASPIALPKEWSFEYIANAIDKINFIGALGVTFMITFCSIALLVLVSSFSAWAMVRSKSVVSNIMFMCCTAAMLIPFQSLMYPLLDIFEKLGLKNVGGLVLMYGGFGLSMSVFLYHGFIKSVPASLEEAAFIDGANLFQMFFKVEFPLLKGTTVTVIVLNGMWIWNDYLLPFLVVGNKEGFKTLTLELYFAKLTSGQYGNPWELIFPAVFITIIPIILLYIVLQKYIVAGVTDGAIKM
ncbi:carbohydrate ABC transporter permease [Anaerocolumna sp. MB42-C2]|uniref:carbohydrate ABC transporter permease n=1 Tax=Anaerocolumna sp. MB42-C2 TaxID=3070997 RepID=UPI0027DF2020|nr:carbohydrate ABC transporter permease [Anaerocolumna sp. MB42-C2]WMJ85875.1 carbohydrate ABC transporter permease [Anaerocolumna sp. MB42-C2]